MSPEEKIASLGLILPKPHRPTRHALPNYVGYKFAGPLLFVGACAPAAEDGVTPLTGMVGADLNVEQAYQHARIAGLYVLAELKDALGELSRVESVVKVFGMVRAIPDFADHPLVVNGCSDLLIQVFGRDIGRHPRTSMGVGSLPHRMSVEVETVFMVR
jgi:hypothetical protein